MYKRVIYWFKRDLRIEDNKALYEACIKSEELIPIFIFIPELLEKFEAFDKRLGFIIDCLKSLNKKINEKESTLYVFYDSAEKVFPYLIKKYKPQAVFTNKSFSYTSEEIEKKVIEICKRNGIDYNAYSDNFLCNIENLPYKKIFSYFYNKWKENLILETYASPNKINTPKINETQLEQIIRKIKYQPNPIWKVDFIYSRLENFDFKNYEHTRNRLDIDGTSKLSPYIRFGVVSLRNVYKKALNASGEDCQFIKELAWREFWYHIKINFPQFKNLEFQEKRRGIKWQRDDKLLKAFIEAKTGYPIIDASIRQLKNENWMHNRARMIVASFFTKDLFMDWREGERFFMKYLIDYDEIVNIGNWQWNASVGADPKPLRIFNPIIQAKKFDPEGNFIKKYVSELKKYPTNMIHDPLKFQLPYHKPVVDHFERVIMIKKTFFKMYHKENI